MLQEVSQQVKVRDVSQPFGCQEGHIPSQVWKGEKNMGLHPIELPSNWANLNQNKSKLKS